MASRLRMQCLELQLVSLSFVVIQCYAWCEVFHFHLLNINASDYILGKCPHQLLVGITRLYVPARTRWSQGYVHLCTRILWEIMKGLISFQNAHIILLIQVILILCFSRWCSSSLRYRWSLACYYFYSGSKDLIKELMVCLLWNECYFYNDATIFLLTGKTFEV